MESAAVALTHEALCSARAIKGLAKSNYDTSADGDIMALLARRSRADKAITTSAASAALADLVLRERLELYVKTRANTRPPWSSSTQHWRLQAVETDSDGTRRGQGVSDSLVVRRLLRRAHGLLHEHMAVVRGRPWRPGRNAQQRHALGLGRNRGEGGGRFQLGALGVVDAQTASGIARANELRLVVFAHWVTSCSSDGCTDEIRKCMRELSSHEGILATADLHIGLGEMVDSVADALSQARTSRTSSSCGRGSACGTSCWAPTRRREDRTSVLSRPPLCCC